MNNQKRVGSAAVALVFGVTLAVSSIVLGHCDTLDGPVVTDAKIALTKGDITSVLKWVMKDHEPELRKAFARTLKVRTKGDDAKELVDLYFFETLVRVHRAGEGAPYTGLKPAGTMEPMVAMLDKSIDKGSIDAIAAKVGKKAQAAITERFQKVMEKKKHVDNSVEAGREYVAAYVTFMHYMEGLHKAVHSKGHHATPNAEAEHAQE